MAAKWRDWLIIGLGGVMAVRMGLSVVRLVRAGDRVRQAERELEAEEALGKELSEQLKYVQSDEFVEKEAREKLGLGKSGEVVVVLPILEQKSPSFAKATEGDANWVKWGRLYLGL